MSFGSGGNDCWLVRTDAFGNAQWNKTYGGAGNDMAHSLIGTFEGGYAMAGRTSSFGAGSSDFWFVKTDTHGNMQWNKTYGGTGEDAAISLIATSDGGYAMVGNTWSFGVDGDFWLVKTDGAGVVPEFSSWLIPSVLLLATTLIVVKKKTLFHKRSK